MTDKQKANAIFAGITFATFLAARPEIMRTSRKYVDLFFVVRQWAKGFEVEAVTAEEYPSKIGAPDLYTVYRNGESYR